MKKYNLRLFCLLCAFTAGIGISSWKAGAAFAEEPAEEETWEDEILDEEAETPVNPFDYIELGQYTGLDVDMLTASVSEEDVDNEIEAFLEEAAVEIEVEDGAEEDDYITFTYTLECDGETVESSEEDTFGLTLGYMEYGEEVDEALLGARPGDTVTADVTLDDYYGDEYEGKDAAYTFEIDKIYRYETPELTDDFVSENTEYSTIEEWREGLEVSLLENSKMMNLYDAGETALRLARENSVFSGYPQELFDTIYEGIEDQYYYFFGDAYTSFISEEELAESAEEDVYLTLTYLAILEKENLQMTEEQYQKYLEDNLNSFGESFDSPEALAETGGEELRESAQRELVCSWLLEHDNVHELSSEEYDEKYGMDFYDEDEEDEDFYLDLEDEDEDEDFYLDLEEEDEEGDPEAAAEEALEGDANE